MNFFEAQANARRKTFWLLFLFALMVCAISFVNAILVGFSIHDWRKHFWPVFGLSSSFFVIAAWIQYLNIRNGEHIVKLMGGRPLLIPNQNPLEKRLYNVVEEMAIASGVPVPQVYILEGEEGINAFVSGTTSHSVVLAVTEGALNSLTRDELQSVIGHEYSHILNEDISLNIKLSGIVSGFYIFVRIGELLARGSGRSRSKDSSSVGLIGLGFIVMGSLGHFFGLILQSMISRQREFLADASSVQFTRNPESLATALAKIQNGPGSELMSRYKYEMSHFFFASGVKGFWNSIFSTHPPIKDRVSKLSPKFKIESVPQIVPQQVAINAESHIAHPDDAKISLFAILVSSQKEDIQNKVLGQLEQYDAKNKKAVVDLLNEFKTSRGDKFIYFKTALGILSHSSEGDQKEVLASMKALFEMDNVVEFQEGLYYLIAENTFFKKSKQGPLISDLRKVEAILQKWVPWILLDASSEIKEKIRQISISQIDIKLQFDKAPQSFSWEELTADFDLVSRLDALLRKKLALYLRQVIQFQPSEAMFKNDEFLLLTWALKIPTSVL